MNSNDLKQPGSLLAAFIIVATASLAAAPALAPLLALFLGLLWPSLAAVIADRKTLASAALLAAGTLLTVARGAIH